MKKIKFTKKKIILSCILLFFLGIGLFVGFYVKTLLEVKDIALKTKAKAFILKQDLKDQNLEKAKNDLIDIKKDLEDLSQHIEKFKIFSFIKPVSIYLQDAQVGLEASDMFINAGIKAIDTIDPYLDLLGLKGKGSFTGGTVEERINRFIDVIGKTAPDLEQIVDKLEAANSKLQNIDPNNYPLYFKGKKIRENIEKYQNLLDENIKLLVKVKPVIKKLPYLLGHEKKIKYLFLFQNDNELRPTGGFLTAYTIIEVDNGKISPILSSDIYDLDKKYTPTDELPERMQKYLKIKKLHIRDMNYDPDFITSMDRFFKAYKTVDEDANFEGIIAIDTKVLTDLLDIIGPVELSGYGEFSTKPADECNCPQVVYALSEIITKPTPYIRHNRKGVLGPLMKEILNKTYSSPSDTWAKLIQASLNDLQEKHILVYIFDKDTRQSLNALNFDGHLSKVDDMDFFGIVDANLGGGKSNLFITYDVKQTINLKSQNLLSKKIEITYKNSAPADNCDPEAGELCLNVILHDWNRIYLPKGSKLISSNGFLEQPIVYDENDFTVIDGVFKLEPKGMTKLSLEVKVPVSIKNDLYNLYIYKQPGIDKISYFLDVNGDQNKFDILTDKVFTTKF